MDYYEVKVLQKPHWFPFKDQGRGLLHELNSNCWCEPVDFENFYAHKMCYKKVVAIRLPIEWKSVV